MTLLATDKRILIIGLGSTGLSCARFLVSQGRPFSMMDSRANPPGLEEFQALCPDTPLRLGELSADWLEQADEIWISPGVALANPAIQPFQHKFIRGDVDVFAEWAKAPIVAITGSNGKSTVTTLVGEMAAAAGRRVKVGGNLGTPVLDLLDEDAELYVIELSSFQLETTRGLGAEVATILNLSQDHMDRYPDMLAYHRAKLRIFQGAQHAVLNRDDVLAQPPLADDLSHTWFTARVPGPGDYGLVVKDGDTWLAKGREALMSVSGMRLAGAHNWMNALVALAIGERLQLPLESSLAVLKDFAGLPHRTQWVREHQGVTYFNDSKATNVGATIAAIDGLSQAGAGRLILILGGQGKEQDFSPLFKAIDGRVRASVVLGEDAPLLAAGVSGDCHRVATLEEAVVLASSLAKAGDRVLLSPACASFDQFSGYEARGAAFCRQVGAL